MSYFSVTTGKSSEKVLCDDLIVMKPVGTPTMGAFSLANDIFSRNDLLMYYVPDHCSTEYQMLLKQLLSVAYVGLEFQEPSIDSASLALKGWDENFGRIVGNKIRTAKLNSLGLACVKCCSFFVASGVVLKGIQYQKVSDFANWDRLGWFAFLMAGACIGVWVSFAISNRQTTMESILQEKDGLRNPYHRLYLALCITLAFGLGAVLEVVGLKFGSIDSKTLTTMIENAVLLGIVFGFNERALSDSFITAFGKLLPTTPAAPPPPGGSGGGGGKSDSGKPDGNGGAGGPDSAKTPKEDGTAKSDQAGGPDKK